MLFIGVKPILKHKKYLYRILVSISVPFIILSPAPPGNHFVHELLTIKYEFPCKGTILHFYAWFSYNQCVNRKLFEVAHL